MSETFNIKSIIVIIIAMIIGVYIILFEKQIIAGLAIIAGGIALNFLEVVKWISELVKFFKSVSKDDGGNKMEIKQNLGDKIKCGEMFEEVMGGKEMELYAITLTYLGENGVTQKQTFRKSTNEELEE